MNYSRDNHTFVVCAYKESPYLEQCIQSVIENGSKVVISTSTPNKHIDDVAKKYGLPMFVNNGEKGISGDWNFAISCANTELVTLAHQDDIYKSNYLQVMLDKINKAKNPILFSSAYGELRKQEEIYSNKLLIIKKILSFPLQISASSYICKRAAIAFGNSICCPSVTYVKEIIERYPFDDKYKAGLDWQKWEELSKLKGSFAFSRLPVVLHRIHADSETSNVIGNSGRKAEDFDMFKKFWPKWIATVLSNLYVKSEESNSL